MSTNKTPNLNLHSWVETDPVLMSEFNENFNALDAASAGYGNSRIATGSYVGTGKKGPDYPNTLFFNFAPKWLIITPHSKNGRTVANLNTYDAFHIDLAAVRYAIENGGQNRGEYTSPNQNSGYANYVYLDNDGKTIRWHLSSSEGGYAANQANELNYIYFYTAIG